MARSTDRTTDPKQGAAYDPVQEAFFLKDVLLIHKKVFTLLMKNSDAMVIYMHYYGGAKWNKEKLLVKMSVDDLWKSVGMSKDRIRAARNWLKGKKLIWDVMARTEDGRRMATSMVGINLYPPGSQEYREYLGYITISNILKGPHSTDVGMGGSCFLNSYDSEDQTPSKKSKGIDLRLDDFRTLYASYPKKPGSADAEKAWKARIRNKEIPPDMPIEFLLARLEKTRETLWNKDFDHPDKDGFSPNICLPSTWINQRRWEAQLPGEDSQSIWSKELKENWDKKPTSKKKDNGARKALDNLELIRDHVMDPHDQNSREIRARIGKAGNPAKYMRWLREGIEEGRIDRITNDSVYPGGSLFDSWAEEIGQE